MARIVSAVNIALLALFLTAGVANPALAVGFGVLGDSLSDEYLGEPDLYGTQTDLPALNWVQILAEVRGVDFGALETDGAVRGEPRNQGYANNWARAGGTANTSPLFLSPSASITNQATALAPAVTAGTVEIVSIHIGHNDFFYRDYLNNGFERIAGNDADLFILDDPSYLAFEDSVFNSIFTAVDTVLSANANAKVALSYLPPGTLMDVDYILAAMQQLNGRLQAEVDSRSNPNLKLVDIYDWGPARRDADGNLLFGGYTIAKGSKASLDQTVPGAVGPCDSAGNCATLAYALNEVAHDTPGGHPGTIMQGLMANEILEAINPWLSSPIALLTDEEVLSVAAVPEPGTALLLLTSLGTLALIRCRK